MSRSSRQVDWCLRKAQKELDECKKLQKRPKHRGLIKGTQNKEEAKNHIKKAEQNLALALSLQNSFGSIGAVFTIVSLP